MKFLIDNALSPLVAHGLCKNGYDATHVRDYDMQRSSDYEIFKLAIKENRVLVSADTDFGTILALYQKSKPSVILFRRFSSPHKQVQLLISNLPSIQRSLKQGCIAVFGENRIRVRLLPIGKKGDT
ncbi:MAG: DUF5615 family PIN-like protein [Firmicutes bacterium]|nr:DUF5615 family PIN-like protein [Bacillota bacterium]